MKLYCLASLFALTLLTATSAHAQLYVGQGDVTSYNYGTGATIGEVATTDGTRAQDIAFASNGVVYEAGFATDSSVSTDQILTVSTYDDNLDLISSDVVSVPATQVPGLTHDSGWGAIGMTASSDGYVYIVNGAYNASTIVSINVTTGAVNTDLTTLSGDNFSGIAASSDGSVLFATDYQLGTVAEINATTGAIITQDFATYYDPHNAKFGYDGQAGTGQDIAVDGNILYVINRDDNTIQTFDATTGALLNNNFINVAENPTTGYFGDFLSAITAVNNVIYVLDGTQDKVFEYNASTGAQIGGAITVDSASGNSGFSEPGSLAVGLDEIGIPIINPIEGLPYEGGDPPLDGDAPPTDAAPEPRSWTMALCIGLAVVGLVSRRRHLHSDDSDLALA